jgi:hypothetical protein
VSLVAADQERPLVSEHVPPSPEPIDFLDIPNVAAHPLDALLTGDGDALSNSVRRVRESAQQKERYAAFGNIP